MDLIWIEDFLTLSVTRNFSKAAALRNVTQPAFSRRIRGLELWVGADLLDRHAKPLGLTPAGEKFRAVAAQSLAAIQSLRDEFRHANESEPTVIRFAALHTLAVALYPIWIKALERQIGPIRSSLVAANLDECLAALGSGECDFLLSYVDPDLVQLRNGVQMQSLHVGEDQLVPVTAVADGRALHLLDKAGSITYLGYAPDSLLGRMTRRAVDQGPRRADLSLKYENSMAEALKAMVLQGAGVAWLPLSSVKDDLAAGTLARAGGDDWVLDLEIRIYRRRSTLPRAAERLWRSLEGK